VSFDLRLLARPAHDDASGRPRAPTREEGPVEAIVGVILIVVGSLEILWIIRTVQANMPKS